MENLLRYKHYFLFLIALIILNFVILPLFILQSEQQENINLLNRKLLKTESLINNKEILKKQNEIITHNELLIPQYTFKGNTDDVKLSIQKTIEETITKANCQLSRVSFTGEEQLSTLLVRWRVEARYKGDINCLMKASRAFEQNKPLISINSFTYNGNKLELDKFAIMNAKLILNFIQFNTSESEQ